MNRLLAWLSGTRVLVALLLAMIAIAIGFGLAGPLLGGPLLDLLAQPQANVDRIAGMSAAERDAHLWVTLTLDAIYPFAYGGVLAGVAARFAPRFARAAALPALLLVLVDTAENALIVAALLGHDGLIVAKSYATHLKWWLFGAASLLALALAGQAALRALPTRLRRRRGQGMSAPANAARQRLS